MDRISNRIREISGEIESYKARLMPFFQNSLEYFSGANRLSEENLLSIRKLTYTSELLYIDINILYPRALEKGEFNLLCDILYSLAAADYSFAALFLSFYGNMNYPISEIGDEVLLFVENCADRVKIGKKAMEFCLLFPYPEQSRFLLHHFSYVVKYSPGTLLDFINLLREKLDVVNWVQIERWIVRGTDLITSNRIDEGVQYLLLRSKESRWLLGINNVILDDLKNILKIYCASLAGMEMIIAGLDTSSFKFSSPYTDGKTIFLPQEINFFVKPDSNEKVYTVLAAQQAAYIRMGTFEFDFGKIDFRDELLDRYGTVLPQILENVRKQYSGLAKRVRERTDGEIEVTFEGGRKILLLNTEHEKYYYSFPTPELARDLFILIENARIEHQLSNVYKGLREDFKLVKSYLWYNRPEITPPGDDPKAQFLAAIECLIQYSLGRRWKGNIDDNRLLGNINRIISEFELIYSEENTVQDTALICFNIYNIFYDNFQIVTYFTKNDLKETFSSIFQPEIYSEVVLDTSPELLKEEELKGEQSEEDEEASVEDEDMAIDFASMRNISREDEYIKKLFAQGKMKIFRYPEFNHLKNSYEDNHCTLFERKLDSEESDYYEFILKKYKYEYKKIKKRFLMMTPDEVEMSRHWLSGEEIHMTDAFDYVMDLLRGESPDEKIYFRKIRNIRDIVVAILIDASSSTLESIDNQRIIDIEKSALTLLSSALDIIGDAFGIFSFFSMGRHRVFINVVKDFDEPWERSIRGRIPSIEGIASNRDGCAIRHIVHRLLGQPHKTKLLILLSDGIPADSNYGSTSSSETNEYAIEDTRRAIIEAKKQGVIPYCITIDRFAKSYIPHLYGDYRYAIINDVTMLPEKLSQLYLKLTR